MTQDANDLLLGSGVPAAKFPTVGTLIKGTVVNSEVSQQRDLDGNLKHYDDGNPMMQVVITIQTDQRDPQVDNDDGTRKLYVKGQMRQAIGDALRAVGAKLERGGTLAVQYVEDEPSQKRGYNPKKVYKAQYKAPALADGDLLGGDAAASSVAQPDAESLI